MTLLRLGLARAATILGALLFWTWAAIKALVAGIGATTVGDDFNQLLERLPRWLELLLSASAWVPAFFGFVLTAFLIWLSWPRAAQSPVAGQPLVTSQSVGKSRSAKLRILFRKLHEGSPTEVSKDNVWRWFVSANVAYYETTSENQVLSTCIYVNFDAPVNPLYNRVTSSKGDKLLTLQDINERYAIIFCRGPIEDDLIEIIVSEDPI